MKTQAGPSTPSKGARRVRTMTEEQTVQLCDATKMKKEQMLITK
jgi:hypothetical protein